MRPSPYAGIAMTSARRLAQVIYSPAVAVVSAFLCYVHAADEHDQGCLLQLAKDIASEFASITMDRHEGAPGGPR